MSLRFSIVGWEELKKSVDDSVKGALHEIGEEVLGQVVTDVPGGKVLYTIVTMEQQILFFGEFQTPIGPLFNVSEVRDNYAEAAELWNSQSEIKFPALDDLVFDSWENMIVRLV